MNCYRIIFTNALISICEMGSQLKVVSLTPVKTLMIQNGTGLGQNPYDLVLEATLKSNQPRLLPWDENVKNIKSKNTDFKKKQKGLPRQNEHLYVST